MNKIIKWLIWPVVIAAPIYLLIEWKKIPERVATHYDLQGNADQFGDKQWMWISIGLIAAVGILIYLLLANVYKIDPKKHAAENKDRLKVIGFTIVVFMSVISISIVKAAVDNGGIKMNLHFVFAAVGFLWAIIGNYLHNIKPNYFAGLRLPWTLENEENWRKTHLVAGRLWFAGGLIVGISWLFVSTTIGIVITVAALVVMIIVPFVYSFRLYRKQKSLGASN